MDEPEGLREEEEAGEAGRVGRVAEEESGAVVEVGGRVGGAEDLILEEAREVRSGDRVVEDVLADEEIGRVDEEGSVDVERRAAEPHHPEGQGVRSLRGAHRSRRGSDRRESPWRLTAEAPELSPSSTAMLLAIFREAIFKSNTFQYQNYSLWNNFKKINKHTPLIFLS